MGNTDRQVKYSAEYPYSSAYTKGETGDEFEGDMPPTGPPEIKKGFFDWLSPVIRVKERQMIDNIGEPNDRGHVLTTRSGRHGIPPLCPHAAVHLFLCLWAESCAAHPLRSVQCEECPSGQEERWFIDGDDRQCHWVLDVGGSCHDIPDQ